MKFLRSVLPRDFKEILITLLITLVYFIAGKFGLKLAFLNASATAVWPPTGIAIASFLLFGYRIWQWLRL